MPDREQHLRKARHNEDLVNHLLSNKTVYRDWAVCGAFYAAVHYIESYLSGLVAGGYHTTNHTARWKLISTVRNLGAIKHEYRNLKDAGWAARYTPRAFTRSEATELQKKMQTIKQHITHLP